MTQALTPLDIATGTMLGCSPDAAPLFDDGSTPREALERAILPALLRPPCLVSFSGGRDSSAVLAVATNLARREGLELPIPATNVFPDAINADETDWQTAVLTHLRLDDWMRFEHRRELDILGPYARRVMRRNGLLLPFNVHFHLPLLDAACGGSLLTGVGGDELFAAARRTGSVLDRGLRAAPRELAGRAFGRAPAAVRRAVHAHWHHHPLPWLRDDARRLLDARVAEIAVREPRSLPARMAWWRRLRYMNAGRAGLALTARDANTLLVHPLMATPLWAAVARTAGAHGFLNRSHGMASLFADLLPAPILTRSTKSHFDEALWTETARSFARDWDGSGVPTEHVDVDALYRHWSGPEPSAQSFTLLQSVWVARAAHRSEEAVHGVLV
jgi:asparagine synthase (glutamine-hydrolysing)